MPRSSDAVDIQEMRSIAAGFLITGEIDGAQGGRFVGRAKGPSVFC